jgi:hypothetical protein
MRAMKDAHFAKQEYTYSRAFPFADFCPEGDKPRLDIGPAN